MLKGLLITAALVLASGTAFADEIIIHRDTEVVPPPPPTSSTTVETHTSADGCASKTVHKEDDAGNSKTVTRTNCD